MNKNFIKIMWTLAGILLTAAGIVCLVHPGIALSVMTLLLGILILISGIADIFAFFGSRRFMAYGSGWFLADGILTILLAVFILFHQVFTMLTLPLILGIWLMFSGITRLVHSYDLKRLEVNGWGWFTFLGILLTLAGFLSFLDPVAGLLTISFAAGVLLILQGVSTLSRAFFTDRFCR